MHVTAASLIMTRLAKIPAATLQPIPRGLRLPINEQAVKELGYHNPWLQPVIVLAYQRQLLALDNQLVAVTR